MGEIKSALELALERTSSVQSDKKLVMKNSSAEAGRKAAFEFLEKNDVKSSSLEEKLKSAGKEEKEWLKEGMFKVLANNIKLPEDESSLDKNTRIRDGFQAISEKKKEISMIFSQMDQLMKQYLQNKAAARENLKRNYARKLQEKEMMLAKQLGKEVHLTPEKDPEFLEYLHKMTAQLDEQYHEVLVKIKEEIAKRL